jgi:hypothetical protein
MSLAHGSRRGAVLTFALLVTGLTATSHVPGAAQAGAWPFELEWEQPGQVPDYYELCVNGSCQWLFARPLEGGRWRAPLPVLPRGEHQVVVRACGVGACVDGTPGIYVRVVRPNPRTPPVVTGPLP